MVYFNNEPNDKMLDMLYDLLIDIFLEGVDDNEENDSGVHSLQQF